MARRNDALGVTGAETLIGSGVIIKGNLTSEGDMVVDGMLTGNIRTISDVHVGNNGEVTGNIAGDNITIAGELTGNITATGEVTIRESGQVHGNISSANLTIISGGIFAGTSIIDGHNEPAPPTKTPSKAEAK